MNKPRGVAADGEHDAAMQEPAAASRDLVGWALQSPLRDDRTLSDAVTRRVLATALGLDEQALASLDPHALQTALRHMRSLVAYCDRLSSEAMTDDLTGAMRRGPGIAALRRELDRARRTGEDGIVVAFLDVVGLKAVNDSEGHAAGDEVLRVLVRSIRERIRSYDLVFRYGGDEFICVLLGVTIQQAERTIGDIRARVVASTGGRTFSVGLAEAQGTDSPEQVIARADIALYRERAASARAS